MKRRTITFIICCLIFGLSLMSCVQQTHIKKVTFELDMRSVADFETVGIRGDIKPLSWQETIVLNDIDGDSIYTTSLEFDTASNQLNFKFVINDEEFELEGQNNRVLPFEYKPEELKYNSSFDQEEYSIKK